jgi:hypothetical protein
MDQQPVRGELDELLALRSDLDDQDALIQAQPLVYPYNVVSSVQLLVLSAIFRQIATAGIELPLSFADSEAPKDIRSQIRLARGRIERRIIEIQRNLPIPFTVPRMVKILKAVESVEPAMMDSLYEEKRMGAAAGVRDWASKPTAVTAERVPGSREPHSASAAAEATAADRSAKMYASGDRETPRPKRAGASRLSGETGDDSGVVPTTDCTEV